MLFKQLNRFSEFGIFTDEFIPKGTLLFSYSDWIEDEKYGWEILTVKEILNLDIEKRERFLRYSYDVGFDKVIGTFNWDQVQHLSNFMNHSCSPNMIYDTEDNIIAKRDILKGEELTIDYGNFIVNVDQSFICNCNSENCRKRITKNDWMLLIEEYGYNFPKFMHKEIEYQIHKSYFKAK